MQLFRIRDSLRSFEHLQDTSEKLKVEELNRPQVELILIWA